MKAVFKSLILDQPCIQIDPCLRRHTHAVKQDRLDLFSFIFSPYAACSSEAQALEAFDLERLRVMKTAFTFRVYSWGSQPEIPLALEKGNSDRRAGPRALDGLRKNKKT